MRMKNPCIAYSLLCLNYLLETGVDSDFILMGTKSHSC